VTHDEGTECHAGRDAILDVMTITTTTSAGPIGAGVLGDLAIRAEDLRKDFGSVSAVRGIDLEVRQGEIVAFLGPNGAGKTTTIDMILGLSEPTAGSVTVLGQTPRSAIAHGLVAAVMQTAGLLKDITVRETLELTGSLFVHHVSVDSVMTRAGISDIGDRRVTKCSGGQQQRLRFAMALLSDPELLILDEPTTGMDVGGRRDFWASIRQDATRGRTILFATHYLEEADEYADRIILVRQGLIVADGTAAQIKAMAAGRTVRATVPGVTREQLAGVPGADSVELRGDTVLIHSKDSDAVARYLLTRTAAHDVEIESRGIEDAFLALTADDEPAAADTHSDTDTDPGKENPS
jgi:ABC-2 type transport system ATP-binding protein